MRNNKTTTSIYLFLITSILLISCNKELPKPNNDNSIDDTVYPIEGINWILTEGRVYVENLDNGEQKVYDYFNNSITDVQMHIFGSTGLKIDSLK
jgi:hypothetical protein